LFPYTTWLFEIGAEILPVTEPNNLIILYTSIVYGSTYINSVLTEPCLGALIVRIGYKKLEYIQVS